MSVLIENIHPGEYIAILELLNKPQPQEGPGYYYVATSSDREVDGYPFRVVAVSAPFLLVQDANLGIRSLDIRGVAVTKVSRKYGDTIHKHPAMVAQHQDAAPSPRKKQRRQRKSKPTEDECPRCGYRMVQRMEFLEKEKFTYCWRWVCPRCDFDNGIVQPGPTK